MSLFTKIFSTRKISRGFTLIELIIVVVIIGILASVAVTRYPQVVKKAKIAEADGILGMMRGAEIRYYAENGLYATVSGTTNPLDVDIPGYGGTAASIYFTYTAAASNGMVKAAGKGTMSDVTVTLKIDGTRSVAW